MDFSDRSFQYAYYVGYVSRTRRTQLATAYERFEERYRADPQMEDVFTVCPFNNSLEQIIRGFQVHENTRRNADLTLALERQLHEFFYLVSDFEPPSPSDGQAFYAETEAGDVVMSCDATEHVFALDGTRVEVNGANLMTKGDFVRRFGELDPGDWPYHQRLAQAV